MIERGRTILGLVRAGDVPLQTPEAAIDELREREISGMFETKPARRIKAGDRVELIGGPFEGRIGVCHSVTGDARADILLELLQRHVRVRIALDV